VRSRLHSTVVRLIEISIYLCLVVALFVCAACDDERFGPDVQVGPVGDIPNDPTVCDIAALVTEINCVACHGGSTQPRLDEAGLRAAIGAPSVNYSGATIIVAGDAQASLLYRKIAGPSTDEGAQMPLGGHLDASLVELVASWIDAGAATECVSSGEGEGEGEGEQIDPDDLPLEPTSCDVAAFVTSRCVACHGGNTAPLLTAEGLAAIVNAPSIRYDGDIVVPGDPAASLLFRKITGPAVDEGQQMPPGQTLPQPLVELVRRWIEGGASTACDPDQVPDPPPLAPGGPIDVGGPPSGYTTTRPGFTDDGPCSTGQWWRFAGDEEDGATMNPGHACISCHHTSGEEDAPIFAFAGTVMGGVPGTEVEILDGDDRVVASTTTNAAGNFYLNNPQIPSFRVRLTYQGRVREMGTHQTAVGDCMSCHTAVGRNGAPGRVVAP
jgi:hypothetical protein